MTRYAFVRVIPSGQSAWGVAAFRAPLSTRANQPLCLQEAVGLGSKQRVFQRWRKYVLAN